MGEIKEKLAEEAEVKLVMNEGERSIYFWVSEGELIAEFTGNHGWFFRNRNKTDVTVILSTGGEYSTMKRVL